MCDPIFLTGVAASGTVGTTGYIAATSGLFGSGAVFSGATTLSTLSSFGSVVGSLYPSGTQQANATYQGQMANYQAKIDENNAIMAERSAEYEADIIDERRARFMGSKDAHTGKSGTVIADGSNLATTINSYEEFTAERLARLHQGDVQAAAHRAGAKGQSFAAQNARDNASRAKLAGYINAGTAVGQGAYRAGLLT